MAEKCPICQTPSQELQRLNACPSCGRELSPSEQKENEEARGSGKNNIVSYTEDSPAWESQKGSSGFLDRAFRTWWQFTSRPFKTFAAPRSQDYYPALGFFFLFYA